MFLLWFKSWKFCIIKKTIRTGFYIWIKSEACRKWFLPGGYASCWNRIFRKNVWANCKTLHGFAVCFLFKVVNLLSMTKFHKHRDSYFETVFSKEYLCGFLRCSINMRLLLDAPFVRLFRSFLTHFFHL